MLLARQVREQLRGKVDPAVSQAIEALAEQQVHLENQMVALAKMVDTLIDMAAVSNEMMDATRRNLGKELRKHGIGVPDEPDPTSQ